MIYKQNDSNRAIIQEILAENKRRNNLLSGQFNPISGKSAPGKRFRCVLPEIILPDGCRLPQKMWLPVALKKHPLITKLMGSNAISASDADSFDRLRIAHDFCYWAARYVKIKRKGGGEDMPFFLNPPQRKLVECFEKARCKKEPIRTILLKARQWGGSTCSQVYMAWMQLTQQPGLNSLIIAHQSAGTEEIKEMFDRLINFYPMRLLMSDEEINRQGIDPKEKKVVGAGRSGAATRVPRRNCKIKIGTAERPDSCRGGDYNLVHLSEVGVWKKTLGKSPEDIVRSACSGVLHTPNTMIIYESTANGAGNFFHREYEAAKRGTSQMQPLFISWYEIPQYRLPVEEPQEFAETLYVLRNQQTPPSDREMPGSYLWMLWQRGATLEGINWYISERAKYGDHAQMASEYPSDDIEAFAHTGARVFERYAVEKLRRECKDPIETGEVEGNAPSGKSSLTNIRFNKDICGGLQIWTHPEKTSPVSNRYLVCVDVGGRSAKADWSVIAVFDRIGMTTGDKPEIVAQWRGHCDIDLLAWRAARIAKYYNDALLVFESNTLETHDNERYTEGDQSNYILTLLRRVYPNLYARRNSEDEIRMGAPKKYGFHTNISTKPMVISSLVSIIRDNKYIERSQDCIDEYLCYERRQNGSYGAIPGRHDDLLMTRAIGLYICFHDMPMPKLISRTRYSNNRHNLGPLPISEASMF